MAVSADQVVVVFDPLLAAWTPELIDGIADRVDFTPCLKAQTVDLQLREGLPLTGGKALSTESTAADRWTAFPPVDWSLQSQALKRRHDQTPAAPILLLAGLSFVAGIWMASRRASREHTRRADRESSHYNLGSEIADVGAEISARGEPSPFEVWRNG